MDKQTGNRRDRDSAGRFAEGNREGNRFPPGVSGNPKGRPVSLTATLRRELEKHPEDKLAIVRSVIECAAKGSARHAELAWQRIDGKVPDIVRIEEHTIELLPPGVVEGRYLNDDSNGGGDSEDSGSSGSADEEPTPGPE